MEPDEIDLLNLAQIRAQTWYDAKHSHRQLGGQACKHCAD